MATPLDCGVYNHRVLLFKRDLLHVTAIPYMRNFARLPTTRKLRQKSSLKVTIDVTTFHPGLFLVRFNPYVVLPDMSTTTSKP